MEGLLIAPFLISFYRIKALDRSSSLGGRYRSAWVISKVRDEKTHETLVMEHNGGQAQTIV